MKTFSIFCIGTGHTSDEEHNILVALHRLTNATPLTPGTPVTDTSRDHYKVLYDGASDLPDILFSKQAATDMITVRDDAVSKINLLAEVAPASAQTVNLIGHSRGAANCLMIASRLHQDSVNVRCNLFLIDTVKVTDILSLEGSVPERDTKRLTPNVDELTHIVMEDDVRKGFRVGTDRVGTFVGRGIFHLYEIDDPNVVGPNDRSRIVPHRFPGRHGTATQCNQIVPHGEDIPGLDDGRMIPKDTQLWPIGGAALAMALRKLKEWDVPLHAQGSRLAYRKKEFFFLNRIQIANQLLARQSRKRLINDSDKSNPGATQKVIEIPGPKLVPHRKDKELNEIGGANLLRHHPIFVNQRHVRLAIAFLGEDLIGAVVSIINDGLFLDADNIARQGTVGGPPSRDLQQAAQSMPDPQFLFRKIRNNVVKHPEFFILLSMQGFTWAGNLLDFRLTREQGI